ncbi:hypothetical protein BRD00_09950 [Halobacteriales archaeon QS_8_69_26]|nr:MAG: hypothetical protein BRD00_09950 [Halobacteriales archaeon QS_8_69_26]
MSGFTHRYAVTEDPNDRYRLLREEMARLRDGAEFPDDVFDPEAVQATLRENAGRVDGDLVILVANDFGQPMAFRPGDLDREDVDRIRTAILENKYDASHEDLAEVRRDLLEAHPRIHKTIVAELADDEVRHHLPEGTSEETNFLTVREMVGLVDYTTNSAQAEGLSVTY